MWPWRKRKLSDDLKAVTEIAGEQIAPGMGTLLLVAGSLAAGAAATYLVHKHRKKKIARKTGASQQ